MRNCLPVSHRCCCCCPEFFGQTKEDEESSEDEDYEDSEEEDIDLEDFEEEDEEDLLGEEDEEEDTTTNMPPPKRKTKTAPKKAASKSPPRKKARAPAPPSPDDTGLEEEMESMSLENGSRYSTACIYGYYMYPFAKDRRDKCSIDFFVPTLPQSSFILKIMPEERNKLQLYTILPTKLTEESRLDRTNAGDDGFNVDTHENTAYKMIARKMKDDHKTEHNPTGRVLLGPQVLTIPFDCEETIVYNVEYHRNRAMVQAIPNHRQFMAVLSVRLTNVEKPMEDAQGGVRIVESEDDDGEDGEDDMEAEGGDEF